MSLIKKLRNVYTGKYIRAKSTKTAALDRTNMACYLDPKPSRECSFRFLPRYRVRVEGDHVRILPDCPIHYLCCPWLIIICAVAMLSYQSITSCLLGVVAFFNRYIIVCVYLNCGV